MNMKFKTLFVGNLEQQLVDEVVANHRSRLEADNWLTDFEIDYACSNIVDCKVLDIEDSIDKELFDRVKKAAGY